MLHFTTRVAVPASEALPEEIASVEEFLTSLGYSRAVRGERPYDVPHAFEFEVRIDEVGPFEAGYRLREVYDEVCRELESRGWDAPPEFTRDLKAEDRSAARTRPARRGRPAGSGGRRAEALEVLKGHPEGVTVAELAEALGIKPNYLYRLLPEMKKDGVIAQGANKRWRTV